MRYAKLFAVIFFIASYSSLQAQQKKLDYAVYTSVPNSNEVMYQTLIGSSTNFNETGFFCIGVESSRSLSKKVFIAGALEYAHHQYKVSFLNPNPFAMSSPDRTGEVTLLTLPVTLRFHFWNYFFVRAGLLADFELKNTLHAKSINEEDILNTQSGIGSVFGIGLHYGFRNGISIFSGLTNEIHGIVLFNASGYKKQLVDVGLQTGVRYSF